MSRSCWMIVIALAATCSPVRGEETPAGPLTFETDVWPIFRAHCFDCHGATDELKGGLDLRLVRFQLKGGDGGPAIEPGDADASYLIQRIRAGEMPPGNAKVTAAELAILEQWVSQGAKTARPEPESIPPGLGILPEERDFWSFQPIRRPEVPATAASDRVRTPIDAFLLEKQQKAGLSFAPDADRLTLLRRASFDLLGLPPTPEQIAQFLADERPDAYERLLDRLLDSPHYGERWARHWLDVAGYADSEGYTADDRSRPHAYRYRDYVIEAFNEDKPFDRFIVEQLAGDELVPPPKGDLSPEQIEALTATGFLRMAADGTASGGIDKDAASNQVIADTIKIVSTSLLGLSVGCAQCHDHRYDPIPHTDYFRMRAVFEPALDWKKWRSPPQRRISLFTAADRARAAEVEAEAQKVVAEKNQKQAEYLAAALETELQKHPEALRASLKGAYETPADKRTAEQQQLLKEHPSVNIRPGVLYQYNPKAAEELKAYDARIAEIRAKRPVEHFVRALTEVPGHAPVTYLFHRGDHRQPTKEIAPGGLTVAAAPGERLEILADDPNLPTTGRRLAYARWLTSGEHPLVSRVLVNRIWMHHFGRGIVDTPSDFGKMGAPPTHPKLLDWLAAEFVEQGWSLKRLHKLMMLSTAYRQSSQRDAATAAIDPDNRLYARMSVRRLDAEAVRDRILATSGRLDRQLGGPPVPVKADEAGQIGVDDGNSRRSIYIEVRRTQPVAMLTAFDAPVMEVNCEQRPSSTVATQSLMLMNSAFILKESQQFAERVRREAAAEPMPQLAAGSVPAELLGSPWGYGYGRFDEGTARTADFRPLPHWTGTAWQGGATLPDGALGWAILNATGGHASHGAAPAVIRRWTAPRDGFLTIGGKLTHGSASGDGIRGRIVSSRGGRLGEFVAANSEAETKVARVEVRQGETIDFSIDCRENVNSDSFGWIVELQLHDAGGAGLGTWNSKTDFRGPPPPSLPQQVSRAWQLAYGRPATADELQLAFEFLRQQIEHLRRTSGGSPEPGLQAMTNLCQALLSSNEFLYVD